MYIKKFKQTKKPTDWKENNVIFSKLRDQLIFFNIWSRWSIYWMNKIGAKIYFILTLMLLAVIQKREKNYQHTKVKHLPGPASSEEEHTICKIVRRQRTWIWFSCRPRILGQSVPKNYLIMGDFESLKYYLCFGTLSIQVFIHFQSKRGYHIAWINWSTNCDVIQQEFHIIGGVDQCPDQL